MRINLNSHPWDLIMHVLIGLAIALPLAFLVNVEAGMAASIAMFYGKEVGEFWYKHKAEYPSGSPKAWLAAYTFFLREKSSAWDWFIVVIAMVVLRVVWSQF
jgi:hypothetical protein